MNVWIVFYFLLICGSPILAHILYQLYLGLRSTDTQLTLARKQEEEEDELN